MHTSSYIIHTKHTHIYIRVLYIIIIITSTKYDLVLE